MLPTTSAVAIQRPIVRFSGAGLLEAAGADMTAPLAVLIRPPSGPPGPPTSGGSASLSTYLCGCARWRARGTWRHAPTSAHRRAGRGTHADLGPDDRLPPRDA